MAHRLNIISDIDNLFQKCHIRPPCRMIENRTDNLFIADFIFMHRKIGAYLAVQQSRIQLLCFGYRNVVFFNHLHGLFQRKTLGIIMKNPSNLRFFQICSIAHCQCCCCISNPYCMFISFII